MTTAAIRTELIDKIEHADDTQVQEIYGLMLNYFNGHSVKDDWETLTEEQKEAINEGLEQLDAGLGIPAEIVIKRVREKYGLNG